MKLAAVLLSGGLDSTTVGSIAVQRGYELWALTFNYGQVHSREIQSARQVAKALNIPGKRHKIVDASLFGELAWYSALTHSERFVLPSDRPIEDMAGEVPISYVPLRNTFFITTAAAFFESAALHAIEVDGCDPADMHVTLFIAANSIDFSGYPDCRPEYYDSVTETLRLGSKLGTQYRVPIRIETPLLSLSKSQIVRVAIANDAPLAYSWSCYKGGDRPCGICDSCIIRAKGFAELGIVDPAL